MLAGGAEEIVTSIDCGGGVPPPPPPLLPPPQALSKAKLRMKRGADFLIILSLREILECSSGLATRYTSAAQKWAQCSGFVTDLLPRPPRASLRGGPALETPKEASPQQRNEGNTVAQSRPGRQLRHQRQRPACASRGD